MSLRTINASEERTDMTSVYRRKIWWIAAAMGCLLGTVPLEGAEPPVDRVLVMYFHRTERCPTCRRMGDYSMEAVKSGFAEQVQAGTVAFHFVDFENPRNAALAKGYKIEGPTLIVAKIHDNKVTAYGNLDEIWTTVADKPAFFRYVQNNVTAFLR
ncbi:MAG: hypothetical protein KJ000_18960 [Pirellulaceae bacterium]|nr:hypothetical protein [Pirellulaceae bacterium]